MTLKNLFYLPIVAGAGFALVALSNSTATLATSHDEEVVITAENCYLHLEPFGLYQDEFGIYYRCSIDLADFQPYLGHILPPINETYDTRENYIQRLYDDMIAGCNERLTATGSSTAGCRNPQSPVRTGYLYSHLPIDSASKLRGQEGELLLLLWADIKINEWGNQERYDQDDLPPVAGSYYVYRPTVEPQPPQEDRDPPQRSPDRPPASLPSESSYRNTHQDNQQGWDDNQADQYRYDGDGYYRRKQQGDGSFKCYFNGYDGSLANLGEC